MSLRRMLTKLAAELYDLEQGITDAGKRKDPKVDKIDSYLRLIMFESRPRFASVMQKEVAAGDVFFLNDILLAFKKAGFFDEFPEKKWIVDVVDTIFKGALRDLHAPTRLLRRGEGEDAAEES